MTASLFVSNATAKCFRLKLSSFIITGRLERFISFFSKALIAALYILRSRIMWLGINFIRQLLVFVVWLWFMELDNRFCKLNAWSLILILFAFICIYRTQLLYKILFVAFSWSFIFLLFNQRLNWSCFINCNLFRALINCNIRFIRDICFGKVATIHLAGRFLWWF